MSDLQLTVSTWQGRILPHHKAERLSLNQPHPQIQLIVPIHWVSSESRTLICREFDKFYFKCHVISFTIQLFFYLLEVFYQVS